MNGKEGLARYGWVWLGILILVGGVCCGVQWVYDMCMYVCVKKSNGSSERGE